MMACRAYSVRQAGLHCCQFFHLKWAESIRIKPAYFLLGNTIHKSATLYVLFQVIILLNKEHLHFYG